MDAKFIGSDCLESKIEVAEDGTFKGYAAVFGNKDLGGDVCVKGCFAKSLADHTAKGRLPTYCFMPPL